MTEAGLFVQPGAAYPGLRNKGGLRLGRTLALAADITSIQQVGHELIVQTSGGGPPRERLQRLSLKGLRAGPAQARLDLEELGDAWPEALLDVVTMLAETSIPAAPASS